MAPTNIYVPGAPSIGRRRRRIDLGTAGTNPASQLGYYPLTADTTLFTADNNIITADATYVILRCDTNLVTCDTNILTCDFR